MLFPKESVPKEQQRSELLSCSGNGITKSFVLGLVPSYTNNDISGFTGSSDLGNVLIPPEADFTRTPVTVTVDFGGRFDIKRR